MNLGSRAQCPVIYTTVAQPKAQPKTVAYD
jgi:hypothetical protein